MATMTEEQKWGLVRYLLAMFIEESIENVEREIGRECPTRFREEIYESAQPAVLNALKKANQDEELGEDDGELTPEYIECRVLEAADAMAEYLVEYF